MNQPKWTSPLTRKWLKCGTTHAGEISSHLTGILILKTELYPHDLFLRSANIAMVAGGSRMRWIIATENMQPGDVIKTSAVIGRMAGKKIV